MSLRFDVALAVCIAVAFSGCSSDRSGLPRAPLSAGYSQRPNAYGYRLLYSFQGGKDGLSPDGGLTEVNGKLYGTTDSGGDVSCYSGLGCGTVFEVGLNGAHRVLHRFAGFPNDGASPQAGLILVQGNLYGTTAAGGLSSFLGTVYRISTSGQEKVIYTFAPPPDGRYSTSELLYHDGLLFGTTQSGGYAGCYNSLYCGTVFGITLSGTEKVLYPFRGGEKDGFWPYKGLTLLKDRLYGTTSRGGASGAGTVFGMSESGKEDVLYSFKGHRDGSYPVAPVTGLNGMLYGVAAYGGAYGLGVVYAISPSGKEKIVHTFKGSPDDGAYPGGQLIVVNGRLYGTTAGGGTHTCTSNGTGCGTVFMTDTSGKEKVLYSFGGGKDGAWPRAGLLDVSGTLYGMTGLGGDGKCPSISGSPPGCGTVFSIAP